MAEPILASYENHGRRSDPRHIDRVMSRSGYDLSMTCPRVGSAGADGIDAGRIKTNGRAVPYRLDRRTLAASLSNGGPDLALQSVEALVVFVSKIKTEGDLAGNDISRGCRNFQLSCRCPSSKDSRFFLGRKDDRCSIGKSVAAHVHRRRAGMCFPAGNGYVVPAHCLYARDDADIDVLLSKTGPCSICNSNIAAKCVSPTAVFSTIADRFDCLAKGDAIGIDTAVGIALIEHAGVDA